MSSKNMSKAPTDAPGALIIGHGLRVRDLATDDGHMGARGATTSLACQGEYNPTQNLMQYPKTMVSNYYNKTIHMTCKKLHINEIKWGG